MSDEATTAPKRHSMFFMSDVYAAADTAAFDLECHGLAPDEVQALSERIHDTITTFFGERRDTTGDST